MFCHGVSADALRARIAGHGGREVVDEFVERGLQRAALGGADGRATVGHTYRCYAGPLLTMLGRHREGTAHLDSFHEVIRDTPQDRWRWGQYLAHRALALVLQHDFGEPLEHAFAQHQQLALSPKKVPHQLKQFYVAKAYARLHDFAEGDARPEKAKNELLAALGDLDKISQHPTLRGHWLCVAAGLKRVEGAKRDAARLLHQASQIAHQTDNPWVSAEVACQRAHLSRAQGSPVRARHYAQDAYRFAAGLGWLPRQHDLQRQFGSLTGIPAEPG